VSKPGAQPPAEPPQQWDALTLESTRTLKARVLVPAAPKNPGAPAVPPPAKARTSEPADPFTLESTITAKARVLPADQARDVVRPAAPAAMQPPLAPPRARLSTNDLHALSLKIKAERDKAELLKKPGVSPPVTQKK
jgi:hypothetical protein